MAYDTTKLSFSERPGQATQALLAGDLDSTWRAMLTPQELTPAERDQLGQKLGLEKGPYAQIFQAVTNPVLIASLILSYKFPIPVGDEVLKVSKKVGGMTSRLPMIKWLVSKDTLFRGTDIPAALDDIVRDVKSFKDKYGVAMGEAARRFQKSTGRLPNEKEQVLVGAWLDGLHKTVRGFQGKQGVVTIGKGATRETFQGVGALFPNLEARMGAPVRQLAQDTRKLLDEAWTDVFGDIKSRERLLKAVRAQKRAGFADDFTDTVEQFLRDPKKLPDYFPHRVLRSEEDFRYLIQQLTASGSSKRFAAAAERKATAWASPEVMKRKYGMIPSSQDLALVKEYVDPREWDKLQRIMKARVLQHAETAGVRTEMVKKLKNASWDDVLENYPKYMSDSEAEIFAGALHDTLPQNYHLKAPAVLNSYVHTMSGTYAWTVKGGGERVIKELDVAKAAAAGGNAYAKARVDLLENTYIPIAMGRGTFRQSLRAQTWAQGMTRLAAQMDSPKIRGLLGDKLTNTLKTSLEDSKGAFSLSQMGRKVSSYFYLSTLGMNPASALTNMTQNVLTLIPMLGVRTTLEGAGGVVRKAHKYFALRLGARGLGHDAAIMEAYPEFAKSGLITAPITDEFIGNTFKNAYGIASLPAKGVSVWEKISRAMMAMFTASETANRLISFEAGLVHARRAKMPIDAALRFARDLTNKAHFVMGPTSGPLGTLELPAPLKQFTYFPLRMLEFATQHAFTMGGNAKNVLGYNPGVAARMVAGSIIAMELGDALGTDLRPRLLGGALPTFQENYGSATFGSLPVVPPTIQLAGSALKGATTGEWGEFLHATPLLVPGGIAAMKVAGFIPSDVPGAELGQAAARALDRTYADYHQPAPDGRIAVYSGKDTFRGYYTPWDIFKSAVGVRGGDLDKEGQLLQMISTQRDQIRESKKSYMDARFKNDSRTAERVARTFKQRFGFDLPVTDADMTGMQVKRTVTRLEQLLRTTPEGPVRETLIQAVQATIGGASEALMGIDPELLALPRDVAARSRFGAGGRRGSAGPQRFDASRLSPLEDVDPQRLGRQRGVTQIQPLP